MGGTLEADEGTVQTMGAIVNAILQVTPLAAYLLIAAVVFAEDALFVGFVIPGETAAVLGGVLASQHRLDLPLVMALVIGAAVLGDTVGYEVGRHGGARILKLRWLEKRRGKLDAARDLLARRGGAAVFLGRFVAFFRAVMPALAGLSHMPYRRFIVYNAAGGIVWGAGAVLLGFLAGNAYSSLAKSVGHVATLAVVGLAAVGLVVWLVRTKKASRRAPEPVPEPVTDPDDAFQLEL